MSSHPSPCHLDHITVTAPSLAAGAAFVRDALGVEPQPGGEHPRMGTHNLLLRLGEALFLEVISPNPHAAPPGRPRWFDLDKLHPDSLPKLATWVARTADIRATAAAASEFLGNIEPMSRGPLSWLITIPADGSPPAEGIVPALIEWHLDTHPAAKLEDRGLSLAGLELFHPDPDRISRLLSSIAIAGPIILSPVPDDVAPYLVAHIDTPSGLRKLSGSVPF